MSLSNTDTPKYYAEFREMVLNGEIPVCETVSLEMNRIDDLIRDPRYFYDEDIVEGWIAFCEGELTLTDGSELKLLLSFKLWAEAVYGWYYFIEKSVYRPYKNGHGGRYVKKTIKKRLINKQYLIVARGSAKTVYDECHQSYGLVMDTTTTHQIATAPTMKQAEEMLSPLRTAISRARGPLFQLLTRGSLQNTTGSEADRKKLVSTKKGIENKLTNSLLEVRPMSIAKLQGLQNKYSTVDEWLSGDIREDVIGALEQGGSKLDDYLIIATSSEGTVRNGVGDTIKIELMDILKGKYYAPNVSIWWYKLDDVKEVGIPELWLKANPNLGETVEREAYELDVERAEHVPSAANDILAKRFGIASEGYTYFFTYAETIPHRRRSYWNMPCSLGVDLSQGDDFCGFTFLFPLPNERFGIKVRSYVTERTMNHLKLALRAKYDEFVEEGSLIVMPGTVLNYDDVYEDISQTIIDFGYDVRCMGYDPYQAETFVKRWTAEYSPYGVEKVSQGSRTETVPLGELKKLSEDRKLLFDEELMSFCIGNCIVLEDTNGNRKLYKMRREEKIDNVSALLDAYVAYKLNTENFE